MEDAPTCDSIARYIAGIQQAYTQQGGVRPFGIATLIAGVDTQDRPVLYQTDPAGISARWKAQVIGGRNPKSLREFVEKHYTPDLSQEASVRLAIQALLEVVEAATLQVCVVETGGKHGLMESDAVQAVVDDIRRVAEENAAAASSE